MTADNGAAADVRARVEGANTSFYWAMRLLPKARREAMFAVYAFCREVDDIADGELPLPEKRTRLDGWRAEVERIYGGEPQSTAGLALADAARDFGLDRADMEAVIDGVEMDATGEALAPDMATLTRYCRCVAGAVGLLSIKIFGDDSPDARRGAIALGYALQFTNILRDVAEDSARGRLYLPRELLAKHGMGGTDPAAVADHPAVAAVCDELADLAETHFREARTLLARCDRRALRPAFAMMEVYHTLLRRMKSRGWTRLYVRPRIGATAKLWIALKNML
jgi:phytoene synthase